MMFGLTVVRPDDVIKGALDLVIKKAKELWKIEYGGIFPTESGFGKTSLRPTHVGVTGTTDQWVFNLTTAGKNTIIDTTISEDAFIILEGFANPQSLSDRIETALQIEAGGDVLPIINLLEAYTMDTRINRWYFEQPIVVQPRSPLKVHLFAPTTGTTKFGLIGTTVAKRSYLIK